MKIVEPWRFMLVVLWTLSLAVMIAVFRVVAGLPLWGLPLLAACGYLFTGAGIAFMVWDKVTAAESTKMIVAWMPGILSYRVRDWIMPGPRWEER